MFDSEPTNKKTMWKEEEENPEPINESQLYVYNTESSEVYNETYNKRVKAIELAITFSNSAKTDELISQAEKIYNFLNK